MSVLSSKLANQKFAYRDVTFCLDGQLSARRDDAMQALVDALRLAENGKGDQRLAAKPGAAERAVVDAIEDEMREQSITLRLTAVPFGEWNKFIIQNPPRTGVSEGFNTSTFFMFVARKTGKFVTDDGELEDVSDAEWTEIENRLTDGDHDRIANALLEINRREGQRGVDFLSRDSKKTIGSDETPESPETQE